MILKEVNLDFPFEWANLHSYRESSAYRKEIYLIEQEHIVEGLGLLFNSLFGTFKDKLLVYNSSWWNFCLDTWDIEKDEYSYDLDGKSIETQGYLKMLRESNIHFNYSGCCICSDWDKFLNLILECIFSHQAPYSPLFCDVEAKYFFYFHHTGSIGIYYKEENNIVKQILLEANKNYKVED